MAENGVIRASVTSQAAEDAEKAERVMEALRRDNARLAYLETDGRTHPEEEDAVRSALLALSKSLLELAAEGFGDGAVEGRLVWALAASCSLRGVRQVAEALRLVEEVRAKLVQQSSGERALRILRELRLTAHSRGDVGMDKAIFLVSEVLDARNRMLERQRVHVALDETETALAALIGLMDALVLRAPAELR